MNSSRTFGVTVADDGALSVAGALAVGAAAAASGSLRSSPGCVRLCGDAFAISALCSGVSGRSGRMRYFVFFPVPLRVISNAV
jgi:hypothetical protein